MARLRKNALPQYVELNARNHTYYYRNPAMPNKANLGKNEREPIRLAQALNARYRIQCEQQAARLEATVNVDGVTFAEEFGAFIEKYIEDYRLKSSTARRLRQRQRRLTETLGETQVPMITTQMLREAIALDSRFEQTKLKTLLLRFSPPTRTADEARGRRTRSRPDGAPCPGASGVRIESLPQGP